MTISQQEKKGHHRIQQSWLSNTRCGVRYVTCDPGHAQQCSTVVETVTGS